MAEAVPAALVAVQPEKQMRLTKFSDYSFRVLLLAASREGRNITIEESARLFGVSAPHLKKVVRALTGAGFLTATRGRSGGFRLARDPEEISLGAVLRVTEPDFGLVECFLPGNTCSITRACRLPPILNRALAAMLEVLDGQSLADIAIDPRHLDALPIVERGRPLPKTGPTTTFPANLPE
jgi:Rrf2 family nitric oxide-sensitive transcriptional repressor